MKIRQTVCGTTMALGLLLGTTACGGDANTQPPAEQPLVFTTAPKSTPTPVDPTVAAKAKVLADYKRFIDTQSRGFVSNSPTFPYEQVMTGKALASTKSVMAGAQLAGLKYGGSIRFLRGEVSSLNLKAKPATATVQACIDDRLTSTSKTGKVTRSGGKASTRDELVLVDGGWKASNTQTLKESEPGCA